MKPATKMMPVAAAVAALSTLMCCLPISLSAAIGVAGLAVAIERYRNLFVIVSVICLAAGVLQLYRFKQACRTNSRSGIAAFSIAAMIVLGVSLFPQVIAVVLADLFPYNSFKTLAVQAPQSDLTAQSLETFRNQFNAAKDRMRVILLLSPT